MRLVVTLVLLLIGHYAFSQVTKSKPITLMGSRFDITVVAKTDIEATNYIDTVVKEITRIENLISEWLPSSQVSLVNANAGVRPVKVARELFDLTQRALQFSVLTEGAFDISFAAMDKIWKFDGSMTSMPTAAEVNKAKENVGYQYVLLDSANSTIYLQKVGMKIGFGATGKGYAADRGRHVLEQLGVKGGVVNAAGDMTAWGAQPSGKPWNIGVTNPFFEDRNMAVLQFNRNAVTTSGSYEKYIEFDGKRYSHIINAKTGMPATGFISVTVVGPSAEMANAISTSIMALGKDKGSLLPLMFPDYGALMVTEGGTIIKTDNFKWKVKSKLRRLR
jgi:thiamine biosynthesis lipoprotein